MDLGSTSRRVAAVVRERMRGRTVTAMTGETAYDRDGYYGTDPRATRIASLFNAPAALEDRLRVRRVQRALPRRVGALLDVGAGDGAFLAAARRVGFDVAGTTASRRSQQAATLRGIDLQYTSNLDAALGDDDFDAITYWHVFEHLEAPDAHVRRWQRLLRPDGRVVVEVPNVDSLGNRLCTESWLGSDPVHHVNMLTEAELRALFEEHGFEIERCEQFSLKFSYPFLWSALLGRIFAGHYDFDTVMTLLQRPGEAITTRPLVQLNALAAIAYLSPLIAALIVAGVATGHGEVLRVTLRRKGS